MLWTVGGLHRQILDVSPCPVFFIFIQLTGHFGRIIGCLLFGVGASPGNPGSATAGTSGGSIIARTWGYECHRMASTYYFWSNVPEKPHDCFFFFKKKLTHGWEKGGVGVGC